MPQTLKVVSGDLLDFELVFTGADKKRYTPTEGSRYFFEIEADPCQTYQQEEAQFSIPCVDLPAGSYPFAAGIDFADGRRLTVLPKAENVLRVLERVEEP